MNKKPFQGTGTALITPFRADGSVDEKALRRLVDFQIGGGIDKEDTLLPQDAETAAITAERLATDRQADLFGQRKERVQSGLQVHDQVRLNRCR